MSPSSDALQSPIQGAVVSPADHYQDGTTVPGSRCVLVTGGAGYIGSHTVYQLLVEHYKVVVIDNLDNSSEESLIRVRKLAGVPAQQLVFLKVDLREPVPLEAVFNSFSFDAVIHFAGLKAVGESVAKPLLYYHNNIAGTINLLEAMAQHGVKRIVFSSSATVYGQPETVPATEDAGLSATNPYGRTKLYIEEIMRDVVTSDPTWSVVLLRYFNPVGAHPSGEIGEDPRGIPNNLMPFIQQVAVGRRKVLTVFGKDYPTKDGTGVRDYIHVMDVAVGHVLALRRIFTRTGCDVYNLGTGKGTSVMEMVAAFEKASGQDIPLKFAERRPGDCAEVYGSTERAERELGFKSVYGIEEMCQHQWHWASTHPYGYQEAASDPGPNSSGSFLTQSTSLVYVARGASRIVGASIPNTLEDDSA